MSDSDDEDCVLYGTPLEEIDEDSIPRKKPINIEDQIATDKQGRRRFHGAFTGGFSAGFFNTVGSLEGWQPATFKSSRSKKADSHSQKPEDFMDDEDRDEFGIAPTVLRAKPEYGGSKKNKRPVGQPFSEHPIPGEPVLKSILEPTRETVGVKLLMKMGWKPGQGVGPRLTRSEKKKNRLRVYGCAPPPGADSAGAYSSDSDSESEGCLDLSAMFAPDDCPLPPIAPKVDTFGMGYSGLDRRSVLGGDDSQHVNLFAPPPPIRDKKNKLSISGQAFGVGAFEEEDSDIYAQDDMSQYDFALECPAKLAEKRRNEKKSRFLAIADSSDVLEGFVSTKDSKSRKKYFPPPELPPGYVPKPRTSRFDETAMGDVAITRNSVQLSAADRGAIVGDGPSVRQVHKPIQNEGEPEVRSEPEVGKKVFRPFGDDIEKQARYERYLNFVKIGAKDAFPSIQPKTMTEWEREKERKEFGDAARLYTPLSGFMAEKFTPAEEKEDATATTVQLPQPESEIAAAARAMMFGKLTRQTVDWAPVSLLCKRFNIPPPWNTESSKQSELMDGLKKKSKVKFSLFDFLEASKHNQLSDLASSSVQSDLTDLRIKEETCSESVSGSNELEPVVDPSQTNREVTEDPRHHKEDVQFEDLTDKKDLFRAIFLSSSSEDEDEEEPMKSVDAIPQTPVNVNNVARNTSPPRGIFANLDLDSLNRPKPAPAPKQPPIEKTMAPEDDPMVYGPKLPLSAVATAAILKPPLQSPEENAEGEWIEKSPSHKHKKHWKKEKHKHKKKKKKRHKD
ncbi:hypothetical protein AAG570_013804 [Ranatra chinensis]|uniref:G-patch domain-containing protein n=1 Tax=Ranatra chinensis TaxID=642074 RepID=A0ABD0YD91_9HEMI